jgi:hypothetical protein
MIETINKIVRTSRQMLHEIGREPTPEELAEKLAMPLEKVRKVLKIAKEPISLETPIGDEEDSHLGDFIEDKNAVLPIDAAIQSNLRETTTRVLASLTPREERVLRMRFGIGMNTDHTLEEVGQQFSVTRERIVRSRRRRCASSSTRAGRGSFGASWTIDVLAQATIRWRREAGGVLLGRAHGRDRASRLHDPGRALQGRGWAVPDRRHDPEGHRWRGEAAQLRPRRSLRVDRRCDVPVAPEGAADGRRARGAALRRRSQAARLN